MESWLETVDPNGVRPGAETLVRTGGRRYETQDYDHWLTVTLRMWQELTVPLRSYMQRVVEAVDRKAVDPVVVHREVSAIM
jgi:hypothetical protein